MKFLSPCGNALLVILLCTFIAEAGPVVPGQTVDGSALDPWTDPPGELVASASHSITFEYVLADGLTFKPGQVTSFSGTLETEVRRHAAGEGLTFIYRFSFDPARDDRVGMEGGQLTLASFTGFITDVPRVDVLSYPHFASVSRSSDGSAISYALADLGQGNLGSYAVATDAVDFDSAGKVSLEVQDFFSVIDDEGEAIRLWETSAKVNVAGVSEPVVEPPLPAIPLLPAFWPGLIALAVVGLCFSRLRHLALA